MALPESVLVDTSAFYALISATDEFHGRARAAYERLLDRDQGLWSTSYVIVETIALVHRPPRLRNAEGLFLSSLSVMLRCSG